MLAAVIVCMLVSLFAILLTVGSVLAKTGFAKLWGTVAGGVVMITAGVVVLSHHSKSVPPVPDPSIAVQNQSLEQAPQQAPADSAPVTASTLVTTTSTAASSGNASSNPQLSALSNASNVAVSSGSQPTTDTGSDISTGQLLASVLQALKSGQSIGEDALNQLPADQREQVRSVASAQ